MKRVLSKQARFRIYLCCLTLVYLVVFSCVLRLNTLSHRREMAKLEKRFEELSSSVVASVSSSPSVEVSSSTTSAAVSVDEPKYFPLGSGRTGNWGYLDIAFPDGSVRRYYFRVGVRRDLDVMMYRLELDSYFVQKGIDFVRSSESVSREDFE